MKPVLHCLKFFSGCIRDSNISGQWFNITNPLAQTQMCRCMRFAKKKMPTGFTYFYATSSILKEQRKFTGWSQNHDEFDPLQRPTQAFSKDIFLMIRRWINFLQSQDCRTSHCFIAGMPERLSGNSGNKNLRRISGRRKGLVSGIGFINRAKKLSHIIMKKTLFEKLN